MLKRVFVPVFLLSSTFLQQTISSTAFGDFSIPTVKMIITWPLPDINYQEKKGKSLGRLPGTRNLRQI